MKKLKQLEMEFLSHHNYNDFPKKYEKNNKPSLTIPNQALTVLDIQKRYASGLAFNGVQEGSFNEEDFPDFKKMDLSEIASFKDYVINNIKEKQATVTKQMEEKKQRDTIEQYKKWKEKEISTNNP